MSRRRKQSSPHQNSRAQPRRQNVSSAGGLPTEPRPSPVSPPRPNRWFLLISALLLAGWIPFLAVLASAT